MYFRPEGKAVAADVIPYYKDGVFYLYYLHDYRDAKACRGILSRPRTS